VLVTHCHSLPSDMSGSDYSDELVTVVRQKIIYDRKSFIELESCNESCYDVSKWKNVFKEHFLKLRLCAIDLFVKIGCFV
jgi:hypothetical protein